MPPIATDGKREVVEFKSVEDVWDIIYLLLEEIDENNDNGASFDIDKSLVAQLPFFTCSTHFYTKQISRDIERYTYCVDTNTPAYPGSYGDQPADWVMKHTIMKNIFAKKESMTIENHKKQAKAKNVK